MDYVPAQIQEQTTRIHTDSVVFDSTSPLFRTHTPRAVDDYRAGGVTAIGATVAAGLLTPETGFAHLMAMHKKLRRHQGKVHLIEDIDDFARAKTDSKLGVTLHFQNSEQFGHDLDSVELYYRMGVRVAQLTYNVKNFVGDGCTERTDAGLSRFGVRLVQEMNRVGMVVDGSHTGTRTTMDAMEVADSPFVFTHTGCRAVYDHPRNITDEQILACAQTGGVVGIYAMPFFVSGSTTPALDDVVRHVSHAVDLVGAEHVGVGMDYANWTHPFTTIEDWNDRVEQFVDNGLWRETDVPTGSWSYAPEIQTPAGMRALTAALLMHGLSAKEVAMIMGENFVRVFSKIWR